jgi:hypothetical protein
VIAGNRILIVVLLLLGLLAACDRGTNYSFSTYKEARQDTSVVGASVPDFLPESSRDIKGWYSVELNEQIVEFAYSAKDESLLVASFRPISAAEETAAKSEFQKYRWSNANTGRPLHFYKKEMKGRVEHLAIDGTHAYYWSRPA